MIALGQTYGGTLWLARIRTWDFVASIRNSFNQTWHYIAEECKDPENTVNSTIRNILGLQELRIRHDLFACLKTSQYEVAEADI